jgi:mannosyltransferase OCH1-like enzyme
MIDKVIHQIWIGHHEIPQREKDFAEEIKQKHPDYQYHFWTDQNLPSIPESLKPMYDAMYARLDYVYCADMLRWLVVLQYGGFYLDIDWQYIKNLNDLNIEHRDGIVFGHWGEGWQHCDYTIANNVFGFAKEHPTVKFFVDHMPQEQGYSNAPHYPRWCGITLKKYMGLENEFSNQIWEYHRIMRENLQSHNIEYGDYNRFQNQILRHFALYSWSNENKDKFKKGLIK